MTGHGKHVTLVHRHVDQPEDDGITQIRPQRDRTRIPVRTAAEYLRGLRIIGQPLRKRFGPEIQGPTRGMRPAVEERHRRHLDQLVGRHLEGHGSPGFQRHFHGLTRRIPRGHHVDRMRNRIHDLNHQFTETAAHSIPHGFHRVNVHHRTGPLGLAGRRIMPRRSERFDQERTHRAVRPRGPAERVVMTEHGPHVGIRPESLPHELHGHDVPDRMIMLQRGFEGQGLCSATRRRGFSTAATGHLQLLSDAQHIGVRQTVHADQRRHVGAVLHGDCPQGVSGVHRIHAATRAASRGGFAGTPDGDDTLHFLTFNVVRPHENDRADVILLGVRHVNGPVTLAGRLGELGIHGHRQPLLLFLFE